MFSQRNSANVAKLAAVRTAKPLTAYLAKAAYKAAILFAVVGASMIYADSPSLNGSDPTPINDRPFVSIDWK